jgi:hypothetical protein
MKITKSQLRQIIKEELEESLDERWQGFKAIGRTLTGQKQPHEKLSGFWYYLTAKYTEATDVLVAEGEDFGGEQAFERFAGRLESVRKYLERVDWKGFLKAAMDTPYGRIKASGMAYGSAIGEALRLWDEQLDEYNLRLPLDKGGNIAKSKVGELKDEMQELVRKHHPEFKRAVQVK